MGDNFWFLSHHFPFITLIFIYSGNIFCENKTPKKSDAEMLKLEGKVKSDCGNISRGGSKGVAASGEFI